MDDLLSSLGLDKYYEVFEANEVMSIDTLLLLSPDMLKDIIPLVGPRAILQEQINKMKSEKTLNKDIDSTASTIANSITPSNDFQLSEIDLGDLSTSSDTSTPRHTSTPTQIPHVANSTKSLNTKLSLHDMLMSTTDGKCVIYHYKKHGLDAANRKVLCDKILQNEMQGDEDHRITTKRFIELSNDIVNLFPKEVNATYYVPFSTVSVAGKVVKKRCAKGKLFDRYHNIRRFLRTSGLLNKSGPVYSKSDELDQSNDNVDDVLQWLKNSLEPWVTVQENWAKTSKARLRILQNGSSCSETITSYFNDFKVLRQPLGYTLIQLDFEHLYPDKVLTLFGQWQDFSEKITKFCVTKKPNDKAIQTLLSELQNDDLNQDLTAIVSFMLLAYIFPPITVRAKGTQWRPSRREMVDSLILHIKTVGELQESLTSRREKLKKLKLTAQPLTVIVGPTLSNISVSYVVVDEVIYKLDTPLKAIDTCFKSFHALHANYPAEIQHVWLFIQSYIYGISTVWDSKFVTVTTMINDLRNS